MIFQRKMTQAGFDKTKEAKKHGLCDTAYTNLAKEQLPSDLKKTLMKKKKT